MEFYQQSAVLPVYQNRVVLITSLRNRKWIIPKGLVAAGMTPRESAAQEAFQEAGLVGDVEGKKLGRYEYRKWSGICSVRVFLMQVQELLDDWEEKTLRDRRLVSPQEAREMIQNKSLRSLVGKAMKKHRLLPVG